MHSVLVVNEELVSCLVYMAVLCTAGGMKLTLESMPAGTSKESFSLTFILHSGRYVMKVYMYK